VVSSAELFEDDLSASGDSTGIRHAEAVARRRASHRGQPSGRMALPYAQIRVVLPASSAARWNSSGAVRLVR
jgi:hypothetical protein